METVSLDSPVQVPVYNDKRLNAIEGASYSKDVMGQMLKTLTFNDYYFRCSHDITIEGLARSLRILQYWECIDGNLDFSKEQILKKLTGKVYSDGFNWWYNITTDEKIKDALRNEEKFTKAIATIKELFPEILR